VSTIADEPEPRDVRLRTRPATQAEANVAMEAWKRRDAEHLGERNLLVRAAKACGVNVRQIALRMGISRTTVYAVLDMEEDHERISGSQP
jgi:DNA-binding NarL/FixJ family response regulator